MVTEKGARPQQARAVATGPLDDITNLFVGTPRGAPARGTTDLGEHGARLSGEILLYGHLEGGQFIVERIRRVALYGALEDPALDPRIGVLSLVGPLDPITTPAGPSGTVNALPLLLHYRALPLLPPDAKDADVRYPQVERVSASLTWENSGQASSQHVRLQLRLDATLVTEKKLGLVQRVLLHPVILDFYLAGTGAPLPDPHQSLPDHCGAVVRAACNPDTYTRSVGLRFVNFSTFANPPGDPQPEPDLIRFCREQVEGACTVWRQKAALELQVERPVVAGSADQVARYSTLQPQDETQLPLAAAGRPSWDAVDRVEVYLINGFSGDAHGGGISYNAGVAAAYVILQVTVPTQNRFLLAHELGHVLGLGHPLNTNPLRDTSLGSIMEAATPNSSINTGFNERILSGAGNVVPLNPLVAAVSNPPPPDCFQPDPEPDDS